MSYYVYQKRYLIKVSRAWNWQGIDWNETKGRNDLSTCRRISKLLSWREKWYKSEIAVTNHAACQVRGRDWSLHELIESVLVESGSRQSTRIVNGINEASSTWRDYVMSGLIDKMMTDTHREAAKRDGIIYR